MRYKQFFCLLSFIFLWGCGLNITPLQFLSAALASEVDGSEAKAADLPEDPGESACSSRLNDVEDKKTIYGERIELYYYRNASQIVSILNQLPFEYPGCASVLPVSPASPYQAGLLVGRGGGNIIFLYGTEEYNAQAKRLITTLDLPLPGIDLQLWGIQISSNKPQKLAQVMMPVRGQIDLTRRLIRTTLQKAKQVSVDTLRYSDLVDQEFKTIAINLGYGSALDGSGSPSLLGIALVGTSIEEPFPYYQNLYRELSSNLVNYQFAEENLHDKNLQNYFKLMTFRERPAFERFFRSFGLKPYCSQPMLDGKGCEIWDWAEINPGSTKKIAHENRKMILEFAFQFSDLRNRPNDFDPEELQQTADTLNTALQVTTDLLQQDIEDLFIRPTLINLQNIVGNAKKVSFAQVGRSTISALNGVPTKINSTATSAFQQYQPQNLGELLSRAQTIQNAIKPLVPQVPISGSSAGIEPSVGPIPVSNLVGLIVAFSEDSSSPIGIETGTNLTFTPGILRNLSSAELNISLSVTDPTFTPTAQQSTTQRPISRVGKQTIETSVYTQALDFFDLSTFTSQATLDGGRGYVPVIGQVWHSIFSGIPGFGKLFSYPKANQNVLHENLLLTNSLITPTPLSLGILYSPKTVRRNFCQNKNDVIKYIESLQSAPSTLDHSDNVQCF